MKLFALVAAVSLAFAAGCDRNSSPTPSPKTDTPSAAPSAAAGSSSSSASSTTSSSTGTPSKADKREGSNPVQGQVDPKHADQHRDFQQRGDHAGPQSSDAKPTMKN